MNKKFVKISLAAVFALGVTAVGTSPAQAANSVTCSGKFSDPTGKQASVICSGIGEARVRVYCNTVWPFPGWSDWGPWMTVAGSSFIYNNHESCGGSLSYGYDTRV